MNANKSHVQILSVPLPVDLKVFKKEEIANFVEKFLYYDLHLMICVKLYIVLRVCREVLLIIHVIRKKNRRWSLHATCFCVWIFLKRSLLNSCHIIY